MSKINEQGIVTIQDRLKRIEEESNLQVEFPEVPEPDCKWYFYYAWGTTMTINLPMDFESANKYKEILEAQGWEFDEKLSNLSKTPDKDIKARFYKTEYSKTLDRDVAFCFAFQLVSWLDGGTCRKVKIGTKTVEEDIYEIVCNDGADENVL